MATRTYCDNCGSTVRNPHKYAFGMQRNFTHGTLACPQCGYCGQVGHQHTAVAMPVGGGHVGPQGVGYYPVVQSGQQPASAEEFIIIDLCDRCRPIWMSRVKALTESSEPDA